ncbi:type II secretion system minor pseudopilin GspK [Ottowia sp.]|uniref:type II secretion system minor pseudopilin GspK n=1 Tax=Ottowia sp. TaxID=1898956 RepID=UPI002CA66AFF|nr:type II secretion system minor pseudopilin GspK [Ottowia sp.]HOB65275.1 type II secretion system minor pseudopilin GspK [Ottowia sp.]HPZ56163.1 type II secretion system minor pseudopilin GspK [Ottowia sp.]HQD48305.1 type II secretion system minor pseudopilin GspK [Ottowia sp.]
MPRRPPVRTRQTAHRQTGAALLAAMLTVVLVATLAAGALWRQWRGVEVEAAERTRGQSAWLLSGALDWSRLILAGDLRESGAVDHLGEPWAVPLAEARLSTFLAAGEASAGDIERDAFLSGQIVDLQSRLNAMNLTLTDPDARMKALLRFQRLFELLGLPSAELGALQRNLARAQAAMTASASEGGDAPLLPRRFDQLVWVGVSPATLAALRPYVTVLPLQGQAPTLVNVNTASAQVIYAAVPGLDLAAAQRLVGERDRAYLRNAASAIAQVATGEADASWTAVGSRFFEVRGRLRLDQLAVEEVSVVQRDPSTRRVTTLWRERTAIRTPAGGS